MLSTINPAQVALDRTALMPQILRPLVSAVERGADVIRTMGAIVRSFGFDNFMYGASASVHPDQESRSYVFTTLSPDWVRRYDECAYIEVDTRISRALSSALPLVWDYETDHGQNARTDAFLDDSLLHGVGSGVVFGMHGSRGTTYLVAYSFMAPQLDEIRRSIILRSLGDLYLVGVHFHEIFVRSILENKRVALATESIPLSPREKACLALAARGHNSVAIARSLGIAERTVQFHFDGIRSKLGAANRQEAVAKGIASGIIQP
jgi:DNA-binding CsgD family transcriptional regulator